MLFLALFSPVLALAHGDEQHDDTGVTVNLGNQSDTTAPGLPEAIANVGGAFALVNHHGDSVSNKTYEGNHMLVFFGYGNCQIMCSISLRRIGDALTLLQNDDSSRLLDQLNALVVTVDPRNDTPAVMKKNLYNYHPALTGLTGSDQQLQAMYEAYGQTPKVKALELNSHSVVSHSSYFYLMGPDGRLKTLFPPILSGYSMANLLKRHMNGSQL